MKLQDMRKQLQTPPAKPEVQLEDDDEGPRFPPPQEMFSPSALEALGKAAKAIGNTFEGFGKAAKDMAALLGSVKLTVATDPDDIKRLRALIDPESTTERKPVQENADPWEDEES